MRPVMCLFRKTFGYTIDQTILIVAIIAILVTIIIISVGWSLINKASGSKLASQLRQLEDANGQFYATYHVWPNESFTATTTPWGEWTASIAALAGSTTMNTYVPQVSGSPEYPKNFISGFRLNPVTQLVEHNFGSTGPVFMRIVTNPNGMLGRFILIRFDRVPFSEVKQAKRVIDGDANQDYATGRITADPGDGTCGLGAPTPGVTNATSSGDNVSVCYVGNLL